MRIDAICVPQGPESQAIRRGLQAIQTGLAPQVITLPIGPEAVVERLNQEILNPLNPNTIRYAVVMGLAGSLSPSYRVGDTVIYQTLTTQVQETWEQKICDRLLTADLSQRLPHADRVCALTSARLISSAQEKQKLHQNTGAVVVDMEGMAALQVLQKRSVAVSMIRVISDDCRTNLPDITPAIQADGSLNKPRLAGILLREPIAALHLICGSLHALKKLEQITTKIFIPE